MKRKKSRRTIRRKVRTGFIILGTILFFSSVIAIFEFVRINRASSGVINDNIQSINAAVLNIRKNSKFFFKQMDSFF